MAKFNLKNYVIKNLVKGFEDGSFSESEVMRLCIGYLTKGILTEEDVAEVDAQITEIIESREQEAEYEEPVEEIIEEEMPTPMDSDEDEAREVGV